MENRFNVLLEESKKFSSAVGLPENLILDIYRASTDWEFILKVDALIETAVKEIVKKSLKLTIKGKEVGSIDEFVESLSISGKTSLSALLAQTGCPSDEISTIDAIRRVRNGYAHQIMLIDRPLIDIIKGRKDRSHLIRYLSAIEKYDETELIEMYEKDGLFLRFGIVDFCLRFLVMAYHIAIK